MMDDCMRIRGMSCHAGELEIDVLETDGEML